MIEKFEEFELENQGGNFIYGGMMYAGINPANGREMYYLEDGSLTYGDL